MKTTLFYGPWQCRQEFMRTCQRECTRAMGCIWLADIKLEWEGRLVVPPLPIKAGSRYGVFHCCCDYPKLAPDKKDVERKRWENFRTNFRRDWSRTFGEWPEVDGVAWAGHHIWDLHHGGNLVDPNNIIPVEPGAHIAFNRAYPACYEGQSPWNKVGPPLPYSDK